MRKEVDRTALISSNASYAFGELTFARSRFDKHRREEKPKKEKGTVLRDGKIVVTLRFAICATDRFQPMLSLRRTLYRMLCNVFSCKPRCCEFIACCVTPLTFHSNCHVALERLHA